MSESTAKEMDVSTDDEAALRARFLRDNQLFLGPDPEIMSAHGYAPRSELEEQLLSGPIDAHRVNLVRGRLLSALSETFTMIEQMGTAPGARWGDLVTAVFTASGDLATIGPKGVVGFATIMHYALKYVIKYWKDDPTVGIRDGDGFIHNDARYGGIHNADQSMMLPVIHNGEIVCWVSATVHEGENGACEPGGLPAAAESKFDEGLQMSPFKVVENFAIKRDLLTYLQNSVRDPKLQMEDMKVKLHACLRLRERILSIIEHYGRDALVIAMRKNIEDTEEEVRRRIRELPDGTIRHSFFIDGTLRENALIKLCIAITVKGDEMTWDLSGSSPEFANRSINCQLASAKTALLNSFLLFVWPDLPRNMAVLAPFTVITDKNSIVDCSNNAPNAMSLITLFGCATLPSAALAKMLYSLPTRHTAIVAQHYNQPATMIYGGVTQHMETVGNFCADINGNGGGARSDRDGEHALSPIFGFMCDTGEQELAENEIPIVRLVSQRLSKDRGSFGKFRGGQGYDQVATVRGSKTWGFMTGCTGSYHSSGGGLFGGYGCPAYPLMKIKNINVFDMWKNNPEDFSFDIITMMNEQREAGAKYSTHDMGMTFELAREGEIYAMSQGCGGAYGDCLERSPDLVMKDIEEGVISQETAWDIYRVAFDAKNLRVDEAATLRARNDEREARKKRGIPYKSFVAQWVTQEPPADLPFYGSWSDRQVVYAGKPPLREVMGGGVLTPTVMPNPKDVRIAELEAENERLRARKTGST